MKAKDLASNPPRRWSEPLGGIVWLPRLIDKTRAALAGTIGDYLYGQSPIDRALLRELGLRYREFTAIVSRAPDDAAVLDALRTDVPDGVARAGAWSAKLPKTHWLFLRALDVDDGYAGGPLRALKAPANAIVNPCMRWLKRRYPSRALDR
ncbi:MAG: DUF5069 domain-containing protein [Rhodanobacteraceae bacterium]